MKLYIVMHWFLDEAMETTKAVSVFSSRQIAQDYINDQKGHPANDDWYIVERTLDEEY